MNTIVIIDKKKKGRIKIKILQTNNLSISLLGYNSKKKNEECKTIILDYLRNESELCYFQNERTLTPNLIKSLFIIQ